MATAEYTQVYSRISKLIFQFVIIVSAPKSQIIY